MTKRRAQLIILCEDKQQAVFARKFFMSHGFSRRQLEFNIAPEGKGSAEQYVRERYAREVSTYRRKSTYLSRMLVVIIDADTYTVKQRLTQLDTALKNASQQRKANEKIAIFVPKKNIETWIHYLMGKTVDEKTNYPKLSRKRDCKPYVEKLVKNICPVGLPENAPPSLYSTCDELERIL